jgi:hypothetical protein
MVCPPTAQQLVAEVHVTARRSPGVSTIGGRTPTAAAALAPGGAASEDDAGARTLAATNPVPTTNFKNAQSDLNLLPVPLVTRVAQPTTHLSSV